MRKFSKRSAVVAVGTVVMVVAAATGGATAKPAQGALTFAPASFDYGQLTNGETQSTTFTLANSAARPSGALSVRVDGSAQFMITENACAGVYLPTSGASCTVTVQFAPTAAGTASATLSAVSKKKVLATASLSGTGVEPVMDGTISGRVTRDGQPLPGNSVEAHNATGLVASATTDSVGSYTMQLAPGDYRVHLGAGQYWEWYDNAADYDTATVVHVDSAATIRVDAGVGSVGRLRGSVTGIGGSPLGGATVWVYDSDGNHVSGDSTDEYGEFGEYLYLAPGDYTVAFSAEGYSSEWYDNRSPGFATVVRITGGDLYNVSADLLSGRLTGVVTDSQGAPLAGMRVEAEEVDSQDPVTVTATTDERGRYFLWLSPPVYVPGPTAPGGLYNIHVYDPANRYYPTGFGNVYVPANDGQFGPTLLDDAVLLRPGRLEGTVTDGSAPLAGIRVELGDYEVAMTDTGGHYSFEFLRPGSYTMRFVDPSGSHVTEWYDDQTSAGSATALTIVEDGSATADALLSPAIAGMVTTP